MSEDYKPGYCRVDQEDQIKCNLQTCAAGMGLAGMGSCFMNGEWWNPNCPQYKNEEEFIDTHYKETQP